jgi:hypothetical protein
MQVLQLSHRFDFLMNTILCISAHHLATLLSDESYTMTAASQVCRALSQFRYQLSHNFASLHLDAFIATSLLLQHEIWSNTDFLLRHHDGVPLYDPSRERVFAVSSSMKQVFLKSLPLLAEQPSFFALQHQENPVDRLSASARISYSTLEMVQNFFSYQRKPGLPMLDVPFPYTRTSDAAKEDAWQSHITNLENSPDPLENGYASAVARLCLILSFLPEAQPPESIDNSSALLPVLARCILSFPVMCRGPFTSMVQQGDPHALILLYHLYRATRILLPPEPFWWAHKRATLSETALREWLAREVEGTK